MEKEKIVMLGATYPYRGGLASFNERLCTQFQEENFDVTIYTFSLQYPGFLFPGTTQFSSEPAPKNLNIKVCVNSINPFNWIKIGLQLKRLRPEIIVVKFWMPFMGPCFGTILRIAKSNKYTKIICIADNIIPHEKRIGDTVLTKYFLKPVDAVITMSDKVLKDLKLFTNKLSIKIAHPLYDNFGEKISKQEARKHLGLNAVEPIILFFGFIRKYKGLDLLLEAMAELKANNNSTFNIQHLKLLVAGEFYDDKKIYDDLIESLGIKESLILKTDFIPDSEVRYYLCACDFVIQPYKNATQSGVTPLAYHYEKPMLVTNVGGLPDLVPNEKVGLVAEPNAISIAEKIKELYTFGEEHFIVNIKEEKKKYSWSILTKTIVELANGIRN
ncbi:MAG: glycosyltransferase [Bacteroidetes bacterium]|nr:glycosyltransferase [Bacteroidota bacterium]